MLSVAGVSTGSYTSPHVLYYNERIAIDGVPASDEEIIAAFERVEAVRGDTPLTYFEFGTLAAISVFEARKVDVAILEVGMGGRLDAVNAIEPTAGLITNVSLDHCEWLGEDVETIALEKAGIMRANTPIIVGCPDAPQQLTAHAQKTGAELIIPGRGYDWEDAGDTWHWHGRNRELRHIDRPALPGAFQLANAAGAFALLESAGFGELLTTNNVNAALASITLPGRLQRYASDRQWLFDVAHNPGAAEALAGELDAEGHVGSTTAIIGMLEDKPVEAVVEPLAGHVDDWIAISADSPRAIPADELARRIANLTNKGCLITDTLEAAIARARDISAEGDRVLVTGSFYVVGPALEALGLYSRGLGNT